MIIDTFYPPVQPDEKPDITIDFVDNVPAGGSISSASVTTRLAASPFTDTSATNKSGAHSISGSRVTQLLHNVTVDIVIAIAATMNTGRVVTDEVYIPAKDY